MEFRGTPLNPMELNGTSWNTRAVCKPGCALHNASESPWVPLNLLRSNEPHATSCNTMEQDGYTKNPMEPKTTQVENLPLKYPLLVITGAPNLRPASSKLRCEKCENNKHIKSIDQRFYINVQFACSGTGPGPGAVCSVQCAVCSVQCAVCHRWRISS